MARSEAGRADSLASGGNGSLSLALPVVFAGFSCEAEAAGVGRDALAGPLAEAAGDAESEQPDRNTVNTRSRRDGFTAGPLSTMADVDPANCSPSAAVTVFTAVTRRHLDRHSSKSHLRSEIPRAFSRNPAGQR